MTSIVAVLTDFFQDKGVYFEMLNRAHTKRCDKKKEDHKDFRDRSESIENSSSQLTFSWKTKIQKTFRNKTCELNLIKKKPFKLRLVSARYFFSLIFFSNLTAIVTCYR
jgi:hypothetical protein